MAPVMRVATSCSLALLQAIPYTACTKSGGKTPFTSWSPNRLHLMLYFTNTVITRLTSVSGSKSFFFQKPNKMTEHTVKLNVKHWTTNVNALCTLPLSLKGRRHISLMKVSVGKRWRWWVVVYTSYMCCNKTNTLQLMLTTLGRM